MPIGVTARLQVKPEATEAFESAFLQYQQQVRASEPGNIFFHLHRNPQKAGEYMVMEQYRDAAALDIHKSADYYKAIPATFGAFMAGPPVIEEFEAVE